MNNSSEKRLSLQTKLYLKQFAIFNMHTLAQVSMIFLKDENHFSFKIVISNAIMHKVFTKQDESH